MSFDFNKSEHLDKVNDILNWLKSGQMRGVAKDEVISQGDTPTCLIIELKDGTTIQILSAARAITTKIPNGWRSDGKSIDGQITIYFSNKRNPIRELSPELKSFIDNGWESFFNNSQH